MKHLPIILIFFKPCGRFSIWLKMFSGKNEDLLALKVDGNVFLILTVDGYYFSGNLVQEF